MNSQLCCAGKWRFADITQIQVNFRDFTWRHLVCFETGACNCKFKQKNTFTFSVKIICWWLNNKYWMASLLWTILTTKITTKTTVMMVMTMMIGLHGSFLHGASLPCAHLFRDTCPYIKEPWGRNLVSFFVLSPTSWLQSHKNSRSNLLTITSHLKEYPYVLFFRCSTMLLLWWIAKESMYCQAKSDPARKGSDVYCVCTL